MKPEEKGLRLLQTVLDNPADDLPRLVYADWLEETSDPDKIAWAADIRRQVTDGGADMVVWNRGIECVYLRGFITEASGPADTLVTEAASMLEYNPIERFRFSGPDDVIYGVVQCEIRPEYMGKWSVHYRHDYGHGTHSSSMHSVNFPSRAALVNYFHKGPPSGNRHEVRLLHDARLGRHDADDDHVDTIGYASRHLLGPSMMPLPADVQTIALDAALLTRPGESVERKALEPFIERGERTPPLWERLRDFWARRHVGARARARADMTTPPAIQRPGE